MKSRPPSLGFEDLKVWIERRARQDLRVKRPLYVAEYQAKLLSTDGDVGRATKHAAAYLHHPLPVWPNLLTSLFDVEYVRLKVADAYKLMERAVPGDAPDASFWISYHLDHWIFQMDAYLDRTEKLFKQVVRGCLRPREPKSWTSFEDDLMKPVAAAKEQMGRLRNPLAHGMGGGVSALVDKWEPVLASPVEMLSQPLFVKHAGLRGHESIDQTRRQRWVRDVRKTNILAFAYMEACSGKLVRKLQSSP